MSPSETPPKISSKIDITINCLNAKWDLQLPHMHGPSACHAESAANSAQKCSAYIRYLHFRLDSLDHLLDGFDQQATRSQSHWVAKPKQENGTLPFYPITKPRALTQDSARKIFHLKSATISNSRRKDLLSILLRILEPEYQKFRSQDSIPASLLPRSQYRDRSIQTDDSVSHTSGQKRGSSSQVPTDAKRHTKRQLHDQPHATISFDSAKSGRHSDPSEAAPGSASTEIMSISDESEEEESQDLFPLQDAQECLQDPLISKSLDSPPPSFRKPNFLDKARSTFGRLRLELPSHLSFDALYEIQSLALSWGTSSMSVFKQLEPLCGASINDAQKRREAIKIVAKGKPPHNLTAPSCWSPDEGEWKSAYLSATAHWALPSSDHLFELQLNGPMLDKTCRFHRYLGGTRFLILNLPFVSSQDIPREHRKGPHDHQEIRAAVLSLLSSEDVVLAGRRWRFFYKEDGVKEIRKQNYSRFVLVAVGGVGLSKFSSRSVTREIGLKDFLDWHLSFRDNLTSSDLKLFARLKLGLSKTIPTVVLDQKQFVEVDDVLAPDGKTVMNDGSALMSFELGDQIRKILGLAEVPAAFQGRISGAKGVWIVDRWHLIAEGCREVSIQVTPSQLKIKPHPLHRDASCDLQRTFEVSGWSHSTGLAAINSQFITVLSDRGVSREVLRARLEESFKHYYDELLAAGDDPRQLRLWLQTFHHVMREDDIRLLGAFPDSDVEKIHMLLDSGFRPTETNLLHEYVAKEMASYTTRCLEKLRIPIPQSTYVYCLPDLCGVLEEGEIHLGLPSSWNDALNGISRSFINDCDGLVARNPANLPSDIQRVRFRFHQQLAECRDVAFFSIKGRVPLASLLSGGDYDGDEVWVCWDQELLADFTNYAPGPPETIKPEDCGLKNCSTPLMDVFPLKVISDDKVNNFLRSCLHFNLSYSYLGRCTNTHQQLVYRDSLEAGGQTALQGPGAVLLAALASFLVDASKQGYELSSEKWSQVKRKACGNQPLAEPAYKLSVDEAKTKVSKTVDKTVNTANVLDFLRFGVGETEKERILTDWKGGKPKRFRDDALIQPFNRLWKQAEGGIWLSAGNGHGNSSSSSSSSSSNNNGDPILREILQQLKRDLEALTENWGRDIASKGQAESDRYRRAVNAACEAFAAIEPLERQGPTAGQHSFYQMVSLIDGFWDLVKVSCLYSEYFRRGKLVFAIAGDKLCEMKAKSVGPTRVVTATMYPVLKVDGRCVKRHAAVDSERDDLLITFAEGAEGTSFTTTATASGTAASSRSSNKNVEHPLSQYY